MSFSVTFSEAVRAVLTHNVSGIIDCKPTYKCLLQNDKVFRLNGESLTRYPSLSLGRMWRLQSQGK